MKVDLYGCLVREKYEPGLHPGNLGDSMAETYRRIILDPSAEWVSDSYFWLSLYFDGAGRVSNDAVAYTRHPELMLWGNDVSSDQVLPMKLAILVRDFNSVERDNCLFLPNGSMDKDPSLISPGLWCVYRKHFKTLNVFNIIQGLLLLFPWRWSDDEKHREKFWKVERSSGKVQDYLNFVCIYIALKRMGLWATMPLSTERCMKAVKKYYLEGEDFEPNSQWIVDLYQRALDEFN